MPLSPQEQDRNEPTAEVEELRSHRHRAGASSPLPRRSFPGTTLPINRLGPDRLGVNLLIPLYFGLNEPVAGKKPNLVSL